MDPGPYACVPFKLPCMRIFKRIILLILLALLLLVGLIVFRTFNFKSRQLTAVEPVPPVKVQGAVERFSEAIRIRTVSPENKKDFDSLQFNHFDKFLVC